MSTYAMWTAIAENSLKQNEPIAVLNHLNYAIRIVNTNDSLWLITKFPGKQQVACRLIFAANDLMILDVTNTKKGIQITAETSSALYRTHVNFPDSLQPVMRYTTTMEAKLQMHLPYWPKDILPLTNRGNVSGEGKIHAKQVGTRSGVLFFSMPAPQGASVFYFQNLTALGPYCEATQTSCKDVVGGEWPELGFSLPTTEDKPLPAGKEFVISDAFLLFSEVAPKSNFEIARQYIDHLAAIYLLIPKPETIYHHWPDTAEKSLQGLWEHKGCWTYAGGQTFLNAYVGDYTTPAESMVQLAVLIPLKEYLDWKEKEHPIVEQIRTGIPAFYKESLGTVVRWLPALEDKLDGSEEQKHANVMDSWYLHHPLLNLTRLAGMGDQEAKQLLLDSIDYAIKVAQHFNYEWPVFYNTETLAVVKAETSPGEGGEKDVPGAYAHLMLEVWKLTGEQRFFDEARAAADKLADKGFDIFYQANNTSFASKALLRLYKETKDEKYLQISYVLIAAIFKNVQLWDCNYGHAKNLPTFFAIFPLSDAPYTAAYEEQEVHAGLLEYLSEAKGLELPPAINLLIAEFIRYTVTRISCYYPPLLPKEMLSEEVNTGEIDPELYVPLEDIHDGWEASGAVGQEVYGAGIAFGILPRQYYKVPGADFILYIDYPISDFRVRKGGTLQFNLLGDHRLTCQLRILKKGSAKLPPIDVQVKAAKEPLRGKKAEKGSLIYTLNGNQQVSIRWKTSAQISSRKPSEGDQ